MPRVASGTERRPVPRVGNVDSLSAARHRAPMPAVLRLGQGEPLRARVAVVGCGGAGCNTLAQVSPDLGVTRVAVNDAAHRAMAGVPSKLILPRETLPGLAAMDEVAVKQIASAEEKAIAGAILNHDLVVPIAGLGGDVGGWAAALTCRVSRILGQGTLVAATYPFAAEGRGRRDRAASHLALLRAKADLLVVFPNDGLLKLAPNLPMARAFQALSAIIVQPIRSLAAAMTRADVRPVLGLFAGFPPLRLGVGDGTGKHRAFAAVEEAYGSPWFLPQPEDIPRILAVVEAADPTELLLSEVLHELQLRSPSASVALGSVVSDSGDRLRVTLLASPP